MYIYISIWKYNDLGKLSNSIILELKNEVVKEENPSF